MSIAATHGKLPFEYSEDLLMADVFAAFRYLPAGIGVIGFLRSVEGLGSHIPVADSSASGTVHFWPVALSQLGREPDALVELQIGDWVGHVVIEAKYASGPSDSADFAVTMDGQVLTAGNQLADQFCDLLEGRYLLFDRARRDRPVRLRSRPEDRFELYLTAHRVRPDEELQRARERETRLSGKLFWSSWYDVFAYLERVAEAGPEAPYDTIVSDVLDVLRLRRFSTFPHLPAPGGVEVDQARPFRWQAR